ncbi:MAG: alpha/beta hydrolase [Sphaerochaetaceae bacterium]|nr:alpha/beta hydrolase [Sphaerochaetaceae bacterium]
MFININNIDIYYENYGKGQPLIFIHGNGEDHTIFYKSADILQSKYNVYLLDSRNHGLSGHVESLHYDDMAEDIVSFIKALNINRPIICGFSDGGILALLVASRYPSLVKAIITCGANTNPHGIKKRPFLEMKREYEETGNELSRLMVQEPHITREDLRRIKCHALILTGEHDIIRLKDTSFIAANIRNNELRILPDEDHGSYVYESDKIAQIIEEEEGFLIN